ncbi:MAG: MFS transporter, partial [candidate division NC10 bacterium]|nr:MFS transporter [candidate division NC10 bacterium]
MHRFRGRPAGWEARAWQGDPTTTLLFLARFLTGVGQGTYFGNDRPVIAAYTPPGKMGFGQGVFFTGLGMGMAIGISMAGLAADRALLRWVSLLFPAAFLLCLVRWLPGIRKADLWLTYFAGIAPI